MNDWETRNLVGKLRAEEGRPVIELAKEYGVSPSSVTRWAEMYRKRKEDRKASDAYDVETYKRRNAELEAEVEQLREEVEALKKTIVVLAREKDE